MMIACARRLRRVALPALTLLSAPLAMAAAPPGPSLAQAQQAMDRLFDAAIAERPASDSSRLVAEAFRPRLQALSGCLPAADAVAGSVDCIATAQAGAEAVHRLLRFRPEQAQWALGMDSRQLAVPVPPQARVQVLLQQLIAARAARAPDRQGRTAMLAAAREAAVFSVTGCAVGDEAPVIECQVDATVGGERGQETMAFTWVEGDWANAAPH